MKTVIEMASEVLDRMAPDDHCREPYWTAIDKELERFAELVHEEANARANASWTLMCEKMVAIEREACAKVCDELRGINWGPEQCATAIRARNPK